MRFLRLEVSDFRAVERASVELAPTLNVLYGPNDLGKTTLATALRAVLLLPADSTAHQAFVPWHRAEQPRVKLTFERGGTVWRVAKTFGSGAAASSQLESSLDGVTFREEERGRAVDRRLREILRWGIEAPGGKGASRGLPESFLSQVLLAAQAAVPDILERTLTADRDGSGRERLHEALQALAQDPVFKRVLDHAQAKVDSAFTPTGRKKVGQSSPFTPLKEQINTLAEEFERYAHQRRESEEVQQRIQLSSSERLAAEASVEALERAVAEQAQALAEIEAAQAVRARHAAARRSLDDARAAGADLARLAEEVVAARRRAEVAEELAKQTAAALSSAEAEAALSDRLLLDQASEGGRARQAVRRAELERLLATAQAELASLRRLAELEQGAAAADAAFAASRTLAERTGVALTSLRQELALQEQALLEARRLEHAGQLREALLAVEQAGRARVEAQALELQAADERRSALELAAVPPALAELSPGRIGELRDLEGQIRVAKGRLEVGLTATVKLIGGGPVSLSVDDGAESTRAGAGETFRLQARGRLRLTLPGAIELDASAGDPRFWAQLEGLQERWVKGAAPLLAALGARNVDELHERFEAGRAQERAAQKARDSAASLESRALEKRQRSAELEAWQRRVEARRQALGSVELEPLLDAVVALGDDWEARSGARAATLERERARLQAELERQTADLQGLRARETSLDEACQRARALRDLARSELSPSVDARAIEVLGGAELRTRSSATEAGAAALRGELEALERVAQAEAGAARVRLERAAASAAEARGRHAAALAASRAARDQQLTLEARHAEREKHVASIDRAAVETRFAETLREVEGLRPLEGVTPEQLAQSRQEHERAVAHLGRCLAELRRAEGALGHIGGDVAVERERQTREALERARELEVELERDYAAYRLLADTLRAIENEQGAHLGRALEAPVSERFARLTEGRYTTVGLDAELGLRGIFIAGQARAYRDLSEGTQEQLATILRLCIAEQLGTALVLDDHLAQTHRQRAAWFQRALREAAERIQIVVITARPDDYLSPDELVGDEPCRDFPERRVRAIDLERVIQRAG